MGWRWGTDQMGGNMTIMVNARFDGLRNWDGLLDFGTHPTTQKYGMANDYDAIILSKYGSKNKAFAFFGEGSYLGDKRTRGDRHDAHSHGGRRTDCFNGNSQTQTCNGLL